MRKNILKPRTDFEEPEKLSSLIAGIVFTIVLIFCCSFIISGCIDVCIKRQNQNKIESVTTKENF
jgi:hypothetical protein